MIRRGRGCWEMSRLVGDDRHTGHVGGTVCVRQRDGPRGA